MGFNYAKEKREFDKEWVHLRAEYEAVGMRKEAITKIYDFDWEWFCSRRKFADHSQALPVECIDVDDTGRSALVNKFESMITAFDESAFYGRYAWVDTVEDANLSDNLKRLSLKDLELLTLIVI
ncbi:MAG: RNA polymerase subunit sigma-70, partial [Clostridia bacterium]